MSKTKLRKMKIKTMELKNFSHIHYKSCHSKESMKENCTGKKLSYSEENTNRIGNTLCCSYGKYKLMAIFIQKINKYKYEIRESFFKSILLFAFEISSRN